MFFRYQIVRQHHEIFQCVHEHDDVYMNNQISEPYDKVTILCTDTRGMLTM